MSLPEEQATEPPGKAEKAIVYVLEGKKVDAKTYKRAKRLRKRAEIQDRKRVKKYRDRGIFS